MPTKLNKDPRITGMTEKELDVCVQELAEACGYLHYHVYEQGNFARRSSKGFPDWVLVHPKSMEKLFIECKTEKGKLTDDQIRWLNALEATGLPVYVFRPSDWFSGRVQRILEANSGQ